LPHAIANLSVPTIAETIRIDDVKEDGGDIEPNMINSEVEYIQDVTFVANVLDPLEHFTDDYNLLIPQQDIFNFIVPILFAKNAI
jgi:hypothetical protein